MKVLETLIIVFALTLFFISFMAGNAIHTAYMEAKVSEMQSATLLAMTPEQLTHVRVL